MRDYIIICIVCYFTGIFYAVVRQISMLFTDNKDSVFIFRILLFGGVQSYYDLMKGGHHSKPTVTRCFVTTDLVLRPLSVR